MGSKEEVIRMGGEGMKVNGLLDIEHKNKQTKR